MYIYFFLLSIYSCNSYENNSLPNYLTNVLKIPIWSNLYLNEDNSSEKIFFQVSSEQEEDRSIAYLEFDKNDKNKRFLIVQIDTENKKEGDYELDIKLKINEENCTMKVSYEIKYYPYANGVGKTIILKKTTNYDGKISLSSKEGLLTKK